MPEELWTEVCDIVQETGIKTISKKKTRKKAKWLSEENKHNLLCRMVVRLKWCAYHGRALKSVGGQFSVWATETKEWKRNCFAIIRN